MDDNDACRAGSGFRRREEGQHTSSGVRTFVEVIKVSVESALQTFYPRINIRFTNSRSLPSPQALALEPLCIFSIVSRCDSFKSKGRKMPRVEIEIVRQAPRR